MTKLYSPSLGPFANEFASTFGLFEFALKKCNHYDVGHGGKIETSWHQFSKANPQINKALFERLKKHKIADTIISDPPKKLIEQAGVLSWVRPGDVTDMESLYFAVKRVRNNLFHGDKALWNPNRDPRLIGEGIAVIRAIITDAPDVRSAFNNAAIAFQLQIH